MAKIYGTIESLKSLKFELEHRGISRFSSIKEIKDFLSNYNAEKLTILHKESCLLEQEYAETCLNLKLNLQLKASVVNVETEKIDNRISVLQKNISSINTKDVNILKKLFSGIKLFVLNKKANYLIDNKDEIIGSSLIAINRTIESDKLFIKAYETGKQTLIDARARPELEQLEHIRHVIENCRNLISGAIGENLVVKEIKKLSDDYALINDFNLRFSPPIFNKKYNQRIYSVQVDHLLISKAGIFIIETKNWSKSSVNTTSLRSPVEQIERSNFALYKYISENIMFIEHHWGAQKIPIRNLIVMINNKPAAEFKHVSVKLLRELNDYVQYFPPALTDDQLHSVIRQLT